MLLAGVCTPSWAARLRVAFVGDPQVDTPAELSYARTSIYSELRARRDIDLVVVLGDLVNNRMELMEPSRASLDSLPCPWICAPGNHDKDLYPKEMQRPRDLQTFRNVLGYTDTTFVMGGIRFISMDNVRTSRTNGYDGALREPQREWLKNVIAASKGQKVVFCTHIPVSWCEDADTLASILAPCSDRLLLVSGHTHAVNRQRVKGVEELTVGAACGTWWRGLKDGRGVPYALMNCGAPRGYFVADLNTCRKQWYTLSYKAENRNASEQCTVVRRDSTLLVNVFGGSAEGEVTVCIGSRRLKASKSKVTPAEVQEVIDFNRSKDRAYRREHKEDFIPMRTMASPHLWEVPVAPQEQISRVKVRYRDPAMHFRSTIEL